MRSALCFLGFFAACSPPPSTNLSCPATGAAASRSSPPTLLRAECNKPGDVVDLKTTEDYRAQLARRWVHCKGAYLPGGKYDGIEFTSDGKWFLLTIEPDGVTLTRRRGFDAAGRWAFLGSGPVRETTPQLNLYRSDGENAVSVVFQDRPAAMRMYGLGPFADYVAAD